MDNMKTSSGDIILRRFYQDEYKDVHTPDGLKQKTLHQMHERNRRGIVIDFRRISAVAALLAIVLFGTVIMSGVLKPVAVIRGGESDNDIASFYRVDTTLSLEKTETGNEEAARFPTELGKLKLTDTASWIVRNANGEAVDHVTQMTYADGEQILQITRSKNEPVSPPELYSVSPREISGSPVYLAKDSNQNRLYASWSDEKGLCSAIMDNGTTRQFVRIIGQLIGK